MEKADLIARTTAGQLQQETNALSSWIEQADQTAAALRHGNALLL